MSWHPSTQDGNGVHELSRRFQEILEQLDTGDYVGASDAMRHWADDGELNRYPDELVRRVRACVMDARAELIHLEPDACRDHIRRALQLLDAHAARPVGP